jgi:hypothetical protein
MSNQHWARFAGTENTTARLWWYRKNAGVVDGFADDISNQQ